MKYLKFNILVLYFTFYSLIIISAFKSKKFHSIIGGEPARDTPFVLGNLVLKSHGEYGYHVQILEDESYICGGALIQLKIVLTAAHCFINTLISDVKILAGTYETQNERASHAQVRKVNKIIAYDNFDLTNKGIQPNDIAIVFLQEKFKPSSYIKTICIASQSTRDKYIGKEVRIMGNGRNRQNLVSLRLQVANVKAQRKDQCNPGKDIDPRNVICGISETFTSCMGDGDSGSPMVKISKNGKHTLLGIASFGYGSKRQRDASCPSIYTDVFEYSEWIAKIINQYEK